MRRMLLAGRRIVHLNASWLPKQLMYGHVNTEARARQGMGGGTSIYFLKISDRVLKCDLLEFGVEPEGWEGRAIGKFAY